MSDRLMTALHDLPVEWPEVPEVDHAAAPRTVRRPRSLVLARVAVAMLLLVLGVIGFVTPVRDAVADWLGIGVVRIEIVTTLPADVGTKLELGTAVTIDAVDLVWPADLGTPDGAFERDGETSVVWAPSDDLPDVVDSGVGAILTRFDGALEPGVEKSLGLGTTLQVVTIGGVRSYWLEGEPHTFGYLDAGGRLVPTTQRLAGNTLIWEQDGSTWRFESALDLEQVLAVLGE